MNTKNWSNVTIISSLCQEPAEISNSELTYSVVEVFETQNISCENVKQNELASWKDNNVYECVQNKNQRCLSLCWVWSIKPTETGLKPTRGLTARRFEEDCLSKSEKESPTCSKNTSRALLGWQSKMIGSYRQSILKQPSYWESILTKRYLLFHHLSLKYSRRISLETS